MEALHEENSTLQIRLENFENRARRSNLHVRGIPETAVDLQSTITALFQELVPSMPIERMDMDRIHRSLPPCPEDGPPRDIVIKLHYFFIKEQLMAAFHNKESLTFQDWTFWSAVVGILSTLFDTSLPPDPTVVLLNNKPLALTRQFKLLLFITTAAKQTIAKVWKSPSLCTLTVKQRVTWAMIHAKIEAVILDKVSALEKLWRPWIAHYLPSGLDNSLLLP